jgi:hypothetical protein
MSDDARLTRIEAKLDDLAKAMVSLVRVEERITTIFNRLDTIDARQAEHSKRLGQLERTSDGRGHALRFAERVFWIVFTAAVGLGFYYMRGG